MSSLYPELINTGKVICIDPGTTHSGIVTFDGEIVHMANSKMPNEELVDILEGLPKNQESRMAIEMFASYGMAVGESTFETVLWIGRFIQAFGDYRSTKIYRKDVKMHLCGTMRAKDANIRRRILDIFPATGGGKTPQVGTIKQQGPLFGVSSHAISALAVGLTYKYGEK